MENILVKKKEKEKEKKQYNWFNPYVLRRLVTY